MYSFLVCFYRNIYKLNLLMAAYELPLDHLLEKLPF